MTPKNRKRRDKVILLIDRKLGVKSTKTKSHIYVVAEPYKNPLEISIREDVLLREIKECLLESNSVSLSDARFMMLSKGIRAALNVASKKQLTNTICYDFQPELIGCGDSFSTFAREHDHSIGGSK